MKKLVWLGRSLDDLKSFPDEVQNEIGYALHCAQMGNTYSSTKMFKGHGSGVYEIVSDFNTDAYRANIIEIRLKQLKMALQRGEL